MSNNSGLKSIRATNLRTHNVANIKKWIDMQGWGNDVDLIVFKDRDAFFTVIFSPSASLKGYLWKDTYVDSIYTFMDGASLTLSLD